MEEVVEYMIEKIEAGTGDFIIPWKNFVSGIPNNFVTGKTYRGFNILSLWVAADKNGYASNSWMTFNQIKAAGGKLRKGAKSAPIFFFKPLQKTEEMENIKTGELEAVETTIPFWKNYLVFNLDDVEGIEKPEPVEIFTNDIERIESIETMIENLGVDLRTGIKSKPFFHLIEDYISLPSIETFTATHSYYAVMLHELTHWTGHENRINRIEFKRFGDPKYAFEELIAELGAAFLCSHFGIDIEKNQHPEYLDGWIHAMKETPAILWNAASKSQEAADWIFEHIGQRSEAA
jgi:antirestriction protein ArdC